MIGMRSCAATPGLNFDGIVSRVAPIGDGIVSRVAPPVDPGSDGGPFPAGCVSPLTEPGFWTGPALSGTCRVWASPVATIRAAPKSANQNIGSRKRITFLLVPRNEASSLPAYRPIPTFQPSRLRCLTIGCGPWFVASWPIFRPRHFPPAAATARPALTLPVTSRARARGPAMTAAPASTRKSGPSVSGWYAPASRAQAMA